MKWSNAVVILGLIAMVGYLGSGIVSCASEVQHPVSTQEEVVIIDVKYESLPSYCCSEIVEGDLVVKWLDREAMPSSYYVIDYSWQPYPLIIPLCERNIERHELPLDYILEQIAEMYKYKGVSP
jgi:hypothetical protein